METLGEMTLAGHRLPIHHATFRRITDDGQGHPGWEFNVCTQPPVEGPAVLASSASAGPFLELS